VWGPFYGNLDNRSRTIRSLGGIDISVKLNQLKGTRTDTTGDGDAIIYTTYTSDLKPRGAKRGG
jgi:hypothetical protein